MASKKFSEFTLSNNSQSVELVGLQAGVNIRTGAVYPAYKDAQGNLVVNNITSAIDETGLLKTNNIQTVSGDPLYYTDTKGTHEVIHTGNTSLLPTPVTDHGSLTGLSDDDHQQYAKKSGDTFTGFLRANLDPVADRDVVPFKYLKDELAKGAFRGVQWKYGGSTSAAPASGYMKIVTTGGSNRDILLNDVDANGYTRSCAAILAGDTLVISTSPTAFARYMVTAKATDNGTYWTIPAVRTDTQGSQTPPAVDTVLTVTATLSGTDVVEEYIPISQKGAPDGVAPLDATGHISADYLNISGFHFIGGWDAAPGILPPDGADGDMYLITNEGTLTVVPPQSTDGIAVPTLCLEGQEIVYQVSKDVWYLMSANTALNDTRYVQLAGSTMTGHLTVPAGASGSQVRRASETDTLLAAKAPLLSPAFTGLPTAPTAPAGTNTTQLATTGFVKDALTTANNTFTHNALAGIQGGAATDHQHLTIDELKVVQGSAPYIIKDGLGTTIQGSLKYDAIGKAFKLVPKKQDGVFVSILTDGDENSSRKYKAPDIKTLIEKKRAKKWGITFMGTTEEQLSKAQDLGISRGNMFSFADSGAGVNTAMKMSGVTRSAYYSTATSSVGLDGLDTDNLIADVQTA